MKLSSLKPYILSSAIIFIVFGAIGMIFAYVFPEISSIFMSLLADKFKTILESDKTGMFFYIFINNTLIDLMAVFFFFLFGLVPIYFLLSNGFIIGLVTGEALKQASLLQIGAGLIPHGILEIPAFILSTSYGLWLGVKFWRKMFYNEPFKGSLLETFRAFFYLILPLNFLAALVEVFITPVIYSLV